MTNAKPIDLDLPLLAGPIETKAAPGPTIADQFADAVAALVEAVVKPTVARIVVLEHTYDQARAEMAELRAALHAIGPDDGRPRGATRQH